MHAVARERAVETERDHWRTLLDVTNAVVTKRDLAELRAAIAPNVRRIVPHDHTNLYLVDEHAAPAVVRDRSDGPGVARTPVEIDSTRCGTVQDLAVARRRHRRRERRPDRVGRPARARQGVWRQADLQRPVIGASPPGRRAVAGPADVGAVYERRAGSRHARWLLRSRLRSRTPWRSTRLPR